MADNPQPEDADGDGDDDGTPPGFPPFLFGGTGAAGMGGPGGFDPTNIDFSQVDLSQLVNMLSSSGPVNWEVARQTAEWIAREREQQAPIADADRKQFEELTHAAQTLVVAETGLYATFNTPIQTVNLDGWVSFHLDALRPVLEALATNLGGALSGAGDDPESEEDLAALFPGLPPGLPMGDLVRAMAPALLGVQAGSMIGYLAQHALGRYDLPLPTGPTPEGDDPSLVFVVPNIDAFEEAWSLPRDDLRFYLAIHEVVHAAERSVPWVRSRLVRLATEYVSSYEIDPMAFQAEFGDIDPTDPSSFESMTASPERILGAMQSPQQVAPREELQRLTSVIEGYADNVLDRLGRRLVPAFRQIHEAKLRHWVERGEADRFIESLLGLKLERAHYERGQAFCEGVVERAGVDGLNRLWDDEAMLPTPNELEAPGLWLARIDLDAP